MADFDPARFRRSTSVEGAVPGETRRGLIAGQSAVREARDAGLFEGPTEHVSFRAPKALIDAARRETGETSTTTLGLTALAMLAQVDPFQAFSLRTRGTLGPDHDLEY